MKKKPKIVRDAYKVLAILALEREAREEEALAAVIAARPALPKLHDLPSMS